MRSWIGSLLMLGLGACGFHTDYTGTHYLCDDGICPSGFTCIAGRCETSGTPSDGNGSDGDAAMLTWWDPAFSRRAQLTITDGAATALPAGFQVGVAVELDTLDSPTAVWDALRVVRWDPVAHTWTEKTRYTEGISAPRTVWFKLDTAIDPGLSNGDYWLYFANPTPAVAPGSGSAVFDFYDAFSGTAINTGRWSVQGTPTVAGDNLTLHSNDSVRTNLQFAPGHAVTISMSGPTNAPRFWVGFQRQTDFADGDPWVIWINRSPAESLSPPGAVAGTIWPETFVSALGMSKADFGTPPATLDGGKHYYTVQRLSDRIVYKYEEQRVYQYMLPTSDSTTLQVRLCNEGGGSIPFGMVHVRQAVWPDPTVTIGATQLH